MRRRIQGLNNADRLSGGRWPQGLFLVRVERVQYHWHAQKPYFEFRLEVLQPEKDAGHRITSRLYCAPKVLWKLTWFLRDFGYDPTLLNRDEIDEKRLVGLKGVVKVRHAALDSAPLLNLDGFAPASQWQEFAAEVSSNAGASEARK